MTFMTVMQSGFNEILYYLSVHVLLCLVPAFFIAGGIAAMLSSGAVLKYFGPQAPKPLAYGVASVSGAILAVCSCTILPIFAGIYKKGAGLGPAITFLFSGPAINVLAISLTARQMGWELGLGRVIGAVLLAVGIGLLIAFIFRKEETAKSVDEDIFATDEESKPTVHILAFFGILLAILIFGTMAIPAISKAIIIVILLGLLAAVCKYWYTRDQVLAWLQETWHFVKLIFPILLVGVFLAGAIKAVIPGEMVAATVGGNSISANLTAAVVGALMYFSTLTEVPIVAAFLDLGMGSGPALALLLAGPSLSLPNMLVIRNVIGTKKVMIYVLLVVILSTIAGLLFGIIVG
ncbi:MAG: permease [Desulfotomaculum sp.]|nr:permease [Desulfotomaculum sp.]